MSAPPAPGSSDEAYWTEQLIAILRSNLTKDYPDGTRTLRDAHTKSHGCVRAEFIVSETVPERFRVGIFSTPRTYQAWIRFSSSANSIRADVKRDVMGMAIKVLDAGPPDTDGAGAQDFDTAERWDFAENLSFAPWHCLPVHEPLGAVNRARKHAYKVLSGFRHDRNHVPPRPPFW
jgi:hypothetical protein